MVALVCGAMLELLKYKKEYQNITVSESDHDFSVHRSQSQSVSLSLSPSVSVSVRVAHSSQPQSVSGVCSVSVSSPLSVRLSQCLSAQSQSAHPLSLSPSLFPLSHLSQRSVSAPGTFQPACLPASYICWMASLTA